jgi:signal transduction histidine kinase
MQPPNLAKLFEWGMLVLLLLFLVCILHFTPGINPYSAGAAFALLACYHLFTTYYQRGKLFLANATSIAHLSISLLLCTLVVWATTTPYEESAFWAIFLLPIMTAATRMALGGTLMVTSCATLFYFLLIPMENFPEEQLLEDLPEFITPALVFLLVALIVQFLSREMRTQLKKHMDLNASLLETQKSLTLSMKQLTETREELLRQQHMATLGEMAAGVAHEIRNPLGIVASSAQLLEDKINTKDTEAEELLLIIREETRRLNGLLNDFLAFGRKTPPNLQACDIEKVVRTCIDRFKSITEPKNIHIEVACNMEQHILHIDPELIEQALLNLVLNGIEASTSGETIHVICTTEGKEILIDIKDNGTGIPEEIRDKIFTPFFTTKAKGSGLGLANAFKCIQAHNGSIDIIETPGPGTCIRVHLPLEN